MQLSKKESKIYETLRKNNLLIFRRKDIQLLLKFTPGEAYNGIKALKQKGVIKNVGKRCLAFTDVNEFIIGQTINYPSYLSFWSALNYYGFSDQQPIMIFFATTHYSKQINNFKYVTLSKKRFFGYVSVGGVTVAEKEKAFVDSLLFPKYAGGVKEIMQALRNAENTITINTLTRYTTKINNKAVVRRLGFLLEQLNYKKIIIEKLRKQIGKGYECLDPSLPKKNKFNKRWLLDINW